MVKRQILGLGIMFVSFAFTGCGETTTTNKNSTTTPITTSGNTTTVDTNNNSTSTQTSGNTTSGLGITYSILNHNSTTDVPLDARFSAIFSEAVDENTLNNVSVSLKSPTSSVNGTISYESSNHTLTFTPESRLKILTNYTFGFSDAIQAIGGGAYSNTTLGFTTLDGTWGNSTTISSNLVGRTNGSNNQMQIAKNNNNDVFAIWTQQESSSKARLYVNGYDVNAKSWANATLIDIGNSASGAPGSPQIAFDSNNNAVAVWHQYDSSHTDIWFNRYVSATDSWGNATLLESASGNAIEPKIAFDSNNNGVAVWIQHNGARNAIFMSQFDNATLSWSNAISIDSENANTSFEAQLAIDYNNNIIVVWSQYDGSKRSLWSNRYNSSNTSWVGATKIESFDNGDVYHIGKIAIDNENNILVPWKLDVGDNDIYMSRYDSNTSSWDSGTRIENQSRYGHYPQVSFDYKGDAIAVWHHYNGSKDHIYANIYNKQSNSWGEEFSLDTSELNSQYPQIAFDGSGNAIIVWRTNNVKQIWAQRYNGTTKTWSVPSLVDGDSDDFSFPQIVIDGNNHATVVYDKQDSAESLRFE